MTNTPNIHKDCLSHVTLLSQPGCAVCQTPTVTSSMFFLKDIPVLSRHNEPASCLNAGLGPVITHPGPVSFPGPSAGVPTKTLGDLWRGKPRLFTEKVCKFSYGGKKSFKKKQQMNKHTSFFIQIVHAPLKVSSEGASDSEELSLSDVMRWLENWQSCHIIKGICFNFKQYYTVLVNPKSHFNI